MCGDGFQISGLGGGPHGFPVCLGVSSKGLGSKFKRCAVHSCLVFPHIVIGSFGLGEFGMSFVSKYLFNSSQPLPGLEGHHDLPMEVTRPLSTFELATDPSDIEGEPRRKLMVRDSEEPEDALSINSHDHLIFDAPLYTGVAFCVT